MKIAQILVVKETREGEGRVALTPNAVAALVSKKYNVMVESTAGILAGFKDEEYIEAGARLFTLDTIGFPHHSLILRVKRPNRSRESLENTLLTKGTVMIGFLDPFDVDHENHLACWHALGVTTISLELLPLTADDPKNAQAAMSRFAGRLALQDAIQRYQGELPKRVTVFGTGPAALGAAFYAKKLHLPVQVFGRREHYRQEIEAAGISYQVLPEVGQDIFIRKHIENETIIITAARSVGQKWPLLIDTATLHSLPEQAVVVDLSTGEGGSVIGSRQDQVITAERGISIVNVSGYPKAEPRAASEAYAQCMVHLLEEIMPSAGELNMNHKLLVEPNSYSEI